VSSIRDENTVFEGQQINGHTQRREDTEHIYMRGHTEKRHRDREKREEKTHTHTHTHTQSRETQKKCKKLNGWAAP
jgi:cytidylate kinase